MPRTIGIRDYFTDDEIFYFEPENIESLADVIYNIYLNPDKATDVVNKGYEIFKNYTWANQSKDLINIYDELIN